MVEELQRVEGMSSLQQPTKEIEFRGMTANGFIRYGPYHCHLME